MPVGGKVLVIHSDWSDIRLPFKSLIFILSIFSSLNVP
jgi:hypothetical protein